MCAFQKHHENSNKQYLLNDSSFNITAFVINAHYSLGFILSFANTVNEPTQPVRPLYIVFTVITVCVAVSLFIFCAVSTQVSFFSPSL